MMPNIPIPTRNIRRAADVNTRFLKRENGMIGSAARSSMGMKTPSSTAETTKPTITRVASQSYPSPTQERARSRATTEAVMVTAPK
jgi:hypothetical protein